MNEDDLRFDERAPLYAVSDLGAEITVMPLALMAEGSLYSDESSQLVKILKAEGVTAAFLDRPDRRHWRVQMGDVPVELVIGVVSSLVGTAIWKGAAAVFRQAVGPSKGKVTLAIQDDPDGSQTTWFTAEGDGEMIERALLAFRPKRMRRRRRG